MSDVEGSDKAARCDWRKTRMNLVHIGILVVLLIVAAVFSHYYWTILEKLSGKIVGGVLPKHYKKREQAYDSVKNQLEPLHSLAYSDIVSVDVMFDTGVTAKIENPSAIEAFKKFLVGGTAIYTRDSEMERLRIQIHISDNSFSYDAFVPAGNKADILLKFPECSDYGAISLSGLKHWLDENILKEDR